MPSIDIEARELEFDVRCECGDDLDCTVTQAGERLDGKWLESPVVIVEPCPVCAEAAKNDGYAEREKEEAES